MKRADALRALSEVKGGAISVATMRAIPTWHEVGGAEGLHFDNLGCMGGAASTGLGLALAKPGHKVIVIDGDGSLCMQLGVLVSIASEAPTNFYHFVLVNGVYETSGAQPIPAQQIVDFEAIAVGAGYRSAHTIASIEAFRGQLPAILEERGPVFIALDIDQEPPGAVLHPSEDRAHDLRKALLQVSA